MEAAKPVFVLNSSLYETPNPYLMGAVEEEQNDESDKIMVEIKSFDIEFHNQNYILDLAKSENNKKIILKICNKKQKKIKFYISYFSLNSFYLMNSFFKFYQTINEIYNLLLDAINEKKYLLEVKSEFINITLKFTIPGGKVIDIVFPLKEEKFKKEDLINELYEMVTQLTEDNHLLKQEINSLKDNINSMNNEIIFLKEENFRVNETLKTLQETPIKKKKKREKKEKLEEKEEKEEIKEKEEMNQNNKNKIIEEEEIEETKTKEESTQEKVKSEEINIINEEKKKKTPKKIINVEKLFNESKIIINEEDKKNLVDWISSKGDISEIKLIYRATENGDDSESFFKKCSNMGPTISLIKTKDKRRFGGFSKAEWTDQRGRIKLRDENAFLFSLDNKKKYNVIKPDIAISCYPEAYTLVYGNKDDRYGVRLFSHFLSKKNYENLSSGVYDVPSDKCLSGSNKFEIEDVEVFQVIFE